MWTDSELQWLDRNKEYIDSDDKEKLTYILPTGNSRVKILVMLTLFMGGEFKIVAGDIKPAYNLFSIWVYSDLFSKVKGFLDKIDGCEWIYKGLEPSPEEVEAGVTKLFKEVGIPDNYIKDLLEKSTLGIGK